MSVSFLKRENLPDLAYELTEDTDPALPTIVFLPGFKSDMLGTKALYLQKHAAAKGQACLRFDYSGHGQSGGRFEEGTIGQWFEDTLAAIDTLTAGRVILVGSSMGGWIGLLATRARPDRVAGFIGIAAAPDFTRDILQRMTAEQYKALNSQGFFSVQGEYSDEPLIITKKLLDDGERHCMLDGIIAIDCPVRLLQGMKDSDVPWEWAQHISDALRGRDKKVILREEGDHRLSSAEDLAILAGLVEELSVTD